MIIKINEKKEFIFGAIPNGSHVFSRMIIGSNNSSLRYSSGIRIKFRSKAKTPKISYTCREDLGTRATMGLYLQKGITWVVYDESKKIICLDSNYGKNTGEDVLLYDNKRNTSLEYEICLPTLNEIADIFIRINDNESIEKVTDYSKEGTLVFLGGPFTLGNGATFCYSSFPYQIAHNLKMDFFNLALWNNNHFNAEIVKTSGKLNPEIIICEINSINMDEEFFKKEIEKYILCVSSLYGKEKIIFFSQPYDSKNEKLVLRDKKIKDIIKNISNSNVKFFDGISAYDFLDFEVISLSNNYVSDYGHYLLSTVISKYLKD